MVLTPAQQQHYRDRGFAVVPGFLDAAAIARISAWLDRMAATTAGAGAEARYYEKSLLTGADLLVRVEHFLGPDNAEVTALLACPKTLAAVAELIGEPPVLFKEKVNYKLPGCRADKLHQDQSAGWNAYGDYFITMAVAVDANRRDNAALTFLSSGNYEQRLMAPEWQPLTDQDPPYEPAAEYSLIEAAPGDVIFFDSYVPHGSPANSSASQRRNIYLTFNRRSAGDQRRRYYDDKWASYPPNRPGEDRAGSGYRV